MKEKFYISLGVWICLVPFVGIPAVWRNILILIPGILLVAVTISPAIFREIEPKKIPRKRQIKNVSPVVTDSISGPDTQA